MTQDEVKTIKVQLKGDLILKKIESIKSQLFTAAENDQDFEIEFLNVQEWDLAGIQLMYALKLQQASKNKSLTFRFSSVEQEAQNKVWLEIIDRNYSKNYNR